MNFNFYRYLVKEMKCIENNKGISARINPKSKKTKKGRKKFR